MQFITTRILPNIQAAHIVVSAWFENGHNMVERVTTLPYLPEYVQPKGGGLGGRVSPSAYRKWCRLREQGQSEIDPKLFWNALREMCDIVNDKPETGSLLPLYPITLIPAFTLRPPEISVLEAKVFIEDVFKVHSFANRKDIVFLLDFGKRGMSVDRVLPIIEHAATTAIYDANCIVVLPSDVEIKKAIFSELDSK